MSLTIATYEGVSPKEGPFLRIPYIICRKLPQHRFREQFLYDEGERLESRKPELYRHKSPHSRYNDLFYKVRP